MTGFVTIANQVSLRWRSRQILNSLSFEWEEGSQVLLTGAPGSGKTLLSKAFGGELFHQGTIAFFKNGQPFQPSIQRVEQHYHFSNRSHVQQFYYQQRFNSTEADDAATIREELEALSPNAEAWMPLLERFSMTAHLDAPLLHLSSGEHKRFQLIRAFLQEPDLMILDEPFTGMDTRSRQLLSELINEKAAAGMQFIVVCEPEQAPACINTTLHLPRNGAVKEPQAFRLPAQLQPLPGHYRHHIEMKDAGISYGNRALLAAVNWTVLPGQAWWLQGANGSGKTTLLSLVTADNPKAYANNLSLFDRRRGTGESIWDIKRHIGFVSPELQWYFDNSMTVFQTVASGLYDTIGLFRQPDADEQETVLAWLEAFDLLPEQDQPLQVLSTSQQRMALLARAMVKNPPLLVLDEPCQGLSDRQQKAFTAVVDQLCADPNRSLVYVTHYENELPRCIDRKVSLQNGKAITSTINRLETISA